MRDMRALVAVALVGVAGCEHQVLDGGDYSVIAVADVSVRGASESPIAGRLVSVRARETNFCGDTTHYANSMLTLSTSTAGRVVGMMSFQAPFLGRVDQCVSVTVSGGSAYRDTTLAPLLITFRTPGGTVDTARVSVTLSPR